MVALWRNPRHPLDVYKLLSLFGNTPCGSLVHINHRVPPTPPSPEWPLAPPELHLTQTHRPSFTTLLFVLIFFGEGGQGEGRWE